MNLFKKYENLKSEDYMSIADPSWPSFEIFITHQNIPENIYNEVDTMLNLEKFDDPAFCILPFIGVEYPACSFCCIITSSNRKDTQQKMLNGNRPECCLVCWNQEDAGSKSDRQIKNSTYDFYTGNLIDLYKQVKVDSNIPMQYYKIDSTITCNATCVTCSPDSSSAWVALFKKNNLPVTHKKIDLSKFDVDYKNAKAISFRGGEPFYSDKNFQILETLIKENNTDCFISFVTNGSVWPTAQQLNIIKQFPNLSIGMSLDGHENVFEYVRYPLKWNDILENINKWRESIPHAKLSVQYTLSNLNVFYYTDTIKWFEKNNLPYSINPVTGPAYFQVGVLPDRVKDIIRQKTESNEVLRLLDIHLPELYDKFLNEIKKQDAMKGIQIQSYLTELSTLLDI